MRYAVHVATETENTTHYREKTDRMKITTRRLKNEIKREKKKIQKEGKREKKSSQAINRKQEIKKGNIQANGQVF